jgi:hypothetical protein
MKGKLLRSIALTVIATDLRWMRSVGSIRREALSGEALLRQLQDLGDLLVILIDTTEQSV